MKMFNLCQVYSMFDLFPKLYTNKTTFEYMEYSSFDTQISFAYIICL